MASISNVGSTNEDKMKLVSRDDKKKAIDLAMQVSLSLKAGEKAESKSSGASARKLSKDETLNSKKTPLSLGSGASIRFQTTGDNQPSVCVLSKKIASNLAPASSTKDKSIASTVVNVITNTSVLVMEIELTVDDSGMDKKK